MEKKVDEDESLDPDEIELIEKIRPEGLAYCRSRLHRHQPVVYRMARYPMCPVCAFMKGIQLGKPV